MEKVLGFTLREYVYHAHAIGLDDNQIAKQVGLSVEELAERLNNEAGIKKDTPQKLIGKESRGIIVDERPFPVYNDVVPAGISADRAEKVEEKKQKTAEIKEQIKEKKAKGYTNAAIAEQLDIAEATVVNVTENVPELE